MGWLLHNSWLLANPAKCLLGFEWHWLSNLLASDVELGSECLSIDGFQGCNFTSMSVLMSRFGQLRGQLVFCFSISNLREIPAQLWSRPAQLWSRLSMSEH